MNLSTLLEDGLDLVQHGQSHGSVELAHFGIDPRIDNLALFVAEVDEPARPLVVLGFLEDDRPTLDGVKHLGRVESERGSIAPLENALAIQLYTKCMRGVLAHPQRVDVLWERDIIVVLEMHTSL